MSYRAEAVRLQSFVPAAYFMAGVLIILPPIDTALNWGVVQPGTYYWRFGAVGSLAGTVLLPMAGLFLAFLTAHVARHEWVQRVLEGVAFVGALALAVVLVLFVLDAVQVRSAVARGFRRFDFAVGRAAAGQLFAMGLLVLLGIASLRTRRSLRRTSPPGSAGDRGPLLAVAGAENKVPADATTSEG